REVLLRGPQRLVVAAERRAAIAADEARGVEAERRVALSLQKRQADERLDAAHEGATGLERVLVVEGDALERFAHGVGEWGVHVAKRLRSSCLFSRGPARGRPRL